MKLSIEYCNQWNYLPRAASLATKLLDKYGEDIQSLSLIPSGGGVFEISKDSSIIFSKKEVGRFPDENEVFKLIGF